jgi:hypothetical protein
MGANGKVVNGKGRVTLEGALSELERELEQTAASAGVRPGKGWQARLRREQLHLPGPDVDGWDPGLMLRWFKFLPPAVQTRAVLLEKLEW